MLLSWILVAATLSTTTIASQVPIINNEKLDSVVSESLYLTLHRALCEIESVSDGEHHIGKWLEEMFEAHHYNVVAQQVPFEGQAVTSLTSSSRLNIYAYPDPKFYGSTIGDTQAKPQVPQPKVLLTSHIDTVPPFIPYSLHYNSSGPFNRSNILIKGRGTVDAKASVAAQITAAMEFVASPPKDLDFAPTDIALLFVVNEEVNGEGMHYFSDSALYRDTRARYKAVLFGEPTERKLVAGHKGIMSITLQAQGKAAHSGYPWLGRSANAMILPTLAMLDQLQYLPVEEGGMPGSEKFGNTTINVGFMQGGVAGNVMAEHANAAVTLRIGGGTVEGNKQRVERAIAKSDPHGLLSYNIKQGYSPVNCDTDVEGFDTITVNYGTDVPNLSLREGVKRYLYGPGNIFVAHGDNEGLTIGELEAGLEGYKYLLEHALRL